MKHLTRKRTRPISKLLALGALLVALSFGATQWIGAQSLIPTYGGPWSSSAYSDICPPNTLCAEWPHPGGVMSSYCCISGDALGSSDPAACQVFLDVRLAGPEM